MTLVSNTVADNSYTLNNPEKVRDGFVVKKKDDATSFQISINCSKEDKTPIYSLVKNGITISSKSGCGVINAAAMAFFNNKIIFSFVFMTIGIILMIFGGYKWNKLLLGVGFFAGVSFVFFLFWAFVQYEPSTKSYIIISVIAIIIGCILGYICKLFDFVSYFCMGFFGGFFLVRFLFSTFPTSSIQDWAVQVITYVVAVTVGVICIFTGKYFMVIITAVIGSFLFWYNFGFLIGVLPNMFDFFQKFKTYGKLDTLNIVFLALAGLTAAAFIYLQYRLIAKEKRKKEEKKTDHFEGLI